MEDRYRGRPPLILALAWAVPLAAAAAAAAAVVRRLPRLEVSTLRFDRKLDVRALANGPAVVVVAAVAGDAPPCCCCCCRVMDNRFSTFVATARPRIFCRVADAAEPMMTVILGLQIKSHDDDGVGGCGGRQCHCIGGRCCNDRAVVFDIMRGCWSVYGQSTWPLLLRTRRRLTHKSVARWHKFATQFIAKVCFHSKTNTDRTTPMKTTQ